MDKGVVYTYLGDSGSGSKWIQHSLHPDSKVVTFFISNDDVEITATAKQYPTSIHIPVQTTSLVTSATFKFSREKETG